VFGAIYTTYKGLNSVSIYTTSIFFVEDFVVSLPVALVALVAVLRYTRVLVQADTTLFTVLNVSDSAALFKTDKLSLE